MDEVRAQLWSGADWNEPLAERVHAIAGGEECTLADAMSLLELVDSVVPDRKLSIELCRWIHRETGDLCWVRRAGKLALEIGDFLLVAELAQLAHAVHGEPGALVARAMALLDAGALERASRALAECVELGPDDASIVALARAAAGDCTHAEDEIRELERAAHSSEPPAGAALLLRAARLSRLVPGNEDTLQLLMRAFDAEPLNESAFALLEDRWIQDQDWRRLSNMYRIRADSSADPIDVIDVYRRAGTRLADQVGSQGLGLRLLQEGVLSIYAQELEVEVSLIAMLSVIVEQHSRTGNMPNAVRLLAQALAHPRSDDEVMWIVNTGIALAAGDQALQRTVATFEALREQVLARHPEVEVETPGGHGHQEAALEDIEEELEGLVRPLDRQGAERIEALLDVHIAVRAELLMDEQLVVVMTRNLSSTGAFLVSQAPLDIGTRLRLRMQLPGEEDWSLVEYELAGVIVRVEAGRGYGVRFDEVPDAYLDDLHALRASRVRQAPAA